MKRLMVLGGSRYILPVIDAAHRLGCHVITCDYLPDSIAHKFSDEYANVSIIDKEAVLRVAQHLKIDGIMSFACDPGVVTAAYVAEQMGLPSVGSYEAVSILQNKGRFRTFLSEHGFNVPTAKGYISIDEALKDSTMFHWPVVVKPADSAGSKGVSKVENPDGLRKSIDYALSFSHCEEFVMEDYLQQVGCSSDTDSMSIDGKLAFVSFNAQRFDEDAVNPYTPAAYSWPSAFTKEQEDYLTSEIQRLITLLGLKTSVYNIETRIGTNGKPYIMELTPRGGGNRLCEMLRYATGVDMITAITRAMVGDSINYIVQEPYNGHWAEIILHADKSGIFDHFEISKELPAEVVEEDLWVKNGDKVESFEGANNAIGTLVLKFRTAEELEHAITHQSEWLKVVVY